ncbi:hypothetical protein [Dermatobacter hominis]|uniref:hypothetical protein n=1 Tax=Dermatobacter hominis TaxID=2884263 RepID=UPI001D0F6EFB|nr:hypothetical protein [Dermatobacter hominis]UDY34403.1 hypothetical protein LH044_13785 [Dermatobacter hominis]
MPSHRHVHDDLVGPVRPSGLVVPRRRLLQGGLALGALAAGAPLLAACGDSETNTQESDAVPDHALLAAFPQSVPHIPAGVPSRLPYLVSDRDGVPLAEIAGDVTFTISQDGKELGTVDVAPRMDGVPRAYLPVSFTFPEPGIYDLTATYDGSELDSTIEVVDRARVGPPVVGEALPPVDSPTVERTLQVDPLCSRVPACPYHSTNLQDVVGKGKPVVMLIATPAYCQTAVCGPVLDLLMAQTEGRTDLEVLHQEVYKDPKGQRDLNDAELAPVPEAYQLRFEPVLYVTDRAGTIVARADVTVDRGELTELLALAV